MALTLHLKDFDGPLDLLLFLIGKAKIDIRDIFVLPHLTADAPHDPQHVKKGNAVCALSQAVLYHV